MRSIMSVWKPTLTSAHAYTQVIKKLMAWPYYVSIQVVYVYKSLSIIYQCTCMKQHSTFIVPSAHNEGQQERDGGLHRKCVIFHCLGVSFNSKYILLEWVVAIHAGDFLSDVYAEICVIGTLPPAISHWTGNRSHMCNYDNRFNFTFTGVLERAKSNWRDGCRIMCRLWQLQAVSHGCFEMDIRFFN